MNESTARSMVITSAVLVSLLGTINSYAQNKRPPSMRFFIGIGIAYMFIGAVADYRPRLGYYTALLVLTTSLFENGQPVLDYLQKIGDASAGKKPNVHATVKNAITRGTTSAAVAQAIDTGTRASEPGPTSHGQGHVTP